MKGLLLPLAAALLAAAVPAVAHALEQQRSAARQETRIPLVSFGTIRNFRPVGDDVVYLQGSHRRWYRAELNGPCISLPAALRIGFDTRYNGNTLDNTSTLIVGSGERCRISSLTLAEGPPPRRRARR